jgi:hypothetical protein
VGSPVVIAVSVGAVALGVVTVAFAGAVVGALGLAWQRRRGR